MNVIKVILVVVFLNLCACYGYASSRIKLNFDFDWKFSLTDHPGYAAIDYSDANWEQVQLPHDWNIKQKFDRKGIGSAAYLPEGIGWYRKTFFVPQSYKGRTVSILFDGIFQQSDVYINGKHLGHRPYGFCSIEYDLTPYLHTGKENVIAVRVNTTGGRPRWYAGAGIYRHVWLTAANPVHVATYGTYITTPEATEDHADVKIVTPVSNQSDKEQAITVTQRLIDDSGKEVARGKKGHLLIKAGNTADVEQIVPVASPRLWTLENPVMYTMETTVKVNNRVTDVYATPIGIRTIHFDKDKGFFLNGKHHKLKGVCLHQDAGCLGVAVPDRSYERRLEILKEYGCNAIRCSHNQPSAEFLDMCDRMGFLVIDEAFDKWKGGYYKQHFDEWWQKDMANMILRDRNHPSIILWSIGNEVGEASRKDNEGIERATMLRDFVHKLEPSRLVTLAAQNNHREEFASVPDVIGYNYLEARMLSDKKKLPERICLVSEELPYYRGEEGRLRSYTPLNPWQIVAGNDFVAGGFIWPGVDYLGEAGWPSKGWPNGLFDVCMFEKPRAAYHRAMWNPKPMVHIAVLDQALDIDHGRDLWQWPPIASHWNFPDKYRGMVMEIRTTTNCESVELFLNGNSMGRHKTANFTNNTIVWYLPYNPGKLEAKGYNGETEVASYRLITSGETDAAIVTADRTELKADGQDLSHIAIHLLDKDGNRVQTDDRKVTVTVKGEGKFLGMDNGDLRRESFTGNTQKTYFGNMLAIVQSTKKMGKISVHIVVEGVDKEYVVDLQSQSLKNK